MSSTTATKSFKGVELPKGLNFKLQDGVDADCYYGVLPATAAFGHSSKGFVESMMGRGVVVRFFQELKYGSKAIIPRAIAGMEAEEYDPAIVFAGQHTAHFAQSELKGGDPTGSLRSDGIDHALMGKTVAFWPPPLTSALVSGSASWAWEVEGDLEKSNWGLSKELWGKLKERLGDPEAVAFRVYTVKEKPTKRWIVRAPKAALSKAVDWTEGDTSIKFVHCCAFCSQSPPWAAYHDQKDCPVLKTINKVRDNEGFSPAVVDESGRIVLGREKKPIDIEALRKELLADIADLKKRVKTLEDKDSQQGKKRKADKPAEKSKAKKPKSEKGGGAKKEESSASGSSSKGKAKAK
ncbi:hypothetical protein DAEQUDRAFT_770869 [Daedalea quercina L-15889]|uniref:Uncharacterized protein n=1 Tax=Daedalea quercina L-15889 TaxID=1314783 RepID=A0A165KHM9_9APHY|nr:hypothetical protein DAEQUDRAFT_770869 [Daedalea quercina L-15889]